MIDKSLLKPQTMPLPNDPNIPNPIPLTFGVQYVFQLKDVVLSEHQHTDTNSHFTIVMQGSFEFTQDGVVRSVFQGDIVDPSLSKHSFKSLEPNSVILNIIKYGTTPESIAADILDLQNDLNKISQTIENMKAVIAG